MDQVQNSGERYTLAPEATLMDLINGVALQKVSDDTGKSRDRARTTLDPHADK